MKMTMQSDQNKVRLCFRSLILYLNLQAIGSGEDVSDSEEVLGVRTTIGRTEVFGKLQPFLSASWLYISLLLTISLLKISVSLHALIHYALRRNQTI